jgi:hypothetical protein
MTNNSISDLQLLANHLRAAVGNALIVIAGVFVLGVISGSGISKWSHSKVESVFTVSLGFGLAAFTWLIYYRTNGLMHKGLMSSDDEEGES